jgi:hypothetical protein
VGITIVILSEAKNPRISSDAPQPYTNRENALECHSESDIEL